MVYFLLLVNNSIQCHLLHVHPPPFLLLHLFFPSCLFGAVGGRVRNSESELAGGMPEGTGMGLRCWEMSAHFHIYLSFGTLARILLCILRQEGKLEKSNSKTREGLLSNCHC